MSTDTLILGRQTFDGLGRQRSVQVAGRSTQYHYRAGQLPPSANTLADGKRVTFTYEPQLGNALLTSHADGATQQRLDYHPTLGLPCSASGEPGSQHWSFDSAGLPLRDAWQVDGEEHSTQWRYSFNGQLLGFTDSGAVEHQRHHDGYGRLSVLKVGEVTTTFAYDVFSRLDTVTTQDPVADRRLTRKITYDSMGREHRNSFTVVNDGNTRTFTQTLAYSGLDQLTSRTWHDGEQQGEETFAYDLRGRMVRYQADLHAAPQDPSVTESSNNASASTPWTAIPKSSLPLPMAPVTRLGSATPKTTQPRLSRSPIPTHPGPNGSPSPTMRAVA